MPHDSGFVQAAACLFLLHKFQETGVIRYLFQDKFVVAQTECSDVYRLTNK